MILIFVFVALSCTKTDVDEQNIKSTLDSFYENINKKDFKTLNQICSPQMTKWLNFVETFGDDIVVYKEWEIKSVEIKGTKAVAKVVAIDQFDNETECVWKLIKAKEDWLMDVFDNSTADITPDEKAEQNTKTEKQNHKTSIGDSL